jgi:hypothetical protein
MTHPTYAVSAALLLLGLPTRGATRGDLARAYRRLAATTHPDLGGSTAAFRRLAAARELLEAVLPPGPASMTATAPIRFRSRPALLVTDGGDYVPWTGADWTGAASGVAWTPTPAPTRRRSRR